MTTMHARRVYGMVSVALSLRAEYGGDIERTGRLQDSWALMVVGCKDAGEMWAALDVTACAARSVDLFLRPGEGWGDGESGALAGMQRGMTG